MPTNYLQKAKRASTTALLQTLPLYDEPIKISGTKYVIKILASFELSSNLKEAIWELFRLNMELLRVVYKSSTVFPWNPVEKRLELFDQTSRFLIIYPDLGDVTGLIAFSMFRFEREVNAEGRPQNVLYCYEVQVSPSFQGNGLGATLANYMVNLAKAWRMKKVMLTVLLSNSRAVRFYEREGFITDEISPDDAEYLILSKGT